MVHLDRQINPSLRARISIALAVAIVAGLFARFKVHQLGPSYVAGDFTWHWRAADALLRGLSPYKVINTTPVYPFSGGYGYFLSTPLVLLPFGEMTPPAAMALFSGIAAGVLAFALMRDGFWRLPLLASAPVVWSTATGQLTPLITAAMLMPSLGWLAPMKFTIGAAGATYNLSPRYVLTAIGIVALSIAIWPWWPREWVAELNDFPHRFYHVPILIPGGILVLLVLLRWRRPEARLVAAMACIPQTMFFYDQLPLCLVVSTYRQALVAALWSYTAPLAAVAIYGARPGERGLERGVLFAHIAPLIVLFYYVPCLIAVLLRPNVGQIPRWLERLSSVLPGRLRGWPSAPQVDAP